MTADPALRLRELGFSELDARVLADHFLAAPGYERWESRAALGYLVLAAICEAQLADPPTHARVVVASDCFPTGVLGYWTARLAEGGLVAALTATSPPRLAHPYGGPPLAGTNPLAIGIPSDGRPLVADVSMGKVTYGDVLSGRARETDLVPFAGEQAHKAFALAVGLQLLVDPAGRAGRERDRLGGRSGCEQSARPPVPPRIRCGHPCPPRANPPRRTAK